MAGTEVERLWGRWRALSAGNRGEFARGQERVAGLLGEVCGEFLERARWEVVGVARELRRAAKGGGRW